MAKNLRQLAIDAFYAGIGMRPRAPYELMLRNDRRPRGEWQREQQEQLARVLQTVSRQVPFYKAQGVGPRLDEFPVLRKEVIDQHYEELIIPGAQKRSDKQSSGSGTTRVAVRMLIDKESYSWHIASRWRFERFHGLPAQPRTAFLALERLQGNRWRRIKDDIGQAIIQRFRLNSATMDEKSVRELQRRMLALRPLQIHGITSIIAAYVRIAREAGLAPLPSLRVVRPAGENVSEKHYKEIGEYFGVPVAATYGAREFGLSAAQCEEGRYHLSPELNYYEVLGSDGRITPYGHGRLLVTTLHNNVMPLVRYDPGDIVTLTEEPCPCGRSLPVMAEIQGRTSELLQLPDGRSLPGKAMHMLLDYMNTRDWRVTQSDPARLSITVVKTADWNAADEQKLAKGIAAYSEGALNYSLEFAESIKPLANGKKPRIINELASRY